MPPQLQAIQVHPSPQSSDSSPEISQTSSSSAGTYCNNLLTDYWLNHYSESVKHLFCLFCTPSASHTATIVTSSVPSSVAGHMMYPGAHVMYATSTPGLGDGGLTVLNTFPQPHTAMHVSHTQAQDSGQSPFHRCILVYLYLVRIGIIMRWTHRLKSIWKSSILGKYFERTIITLFKSAIFQFYCILCFGYV